MRPYDMAEESGRREVDSRRLLSHVSALCALGERTAGSKAEALACNYIIHELKDYGLQPKVHEFRALISNPVSASLSVTFPESHHMEGVGAAFSISTPPCGLSGEVVFAGKGRPEDYKNLNANGKIVLLSGLVSSLQAHVAVLNEAIALVGTAEGQALPKNTTSTVWGNPGIEQKNNLPHLPVVCVSKQNGDILHTLALRGNLRVTVFTETSEELRTLHLPVVEIAGKSNLFALVGGHYCSWFDGATDNATGNAALLELARLFSLHREALTFGVRIAWWPGHSHGRFCGSAWYAENFWQDLYDNCTAYFNIDSPGCAGATACMPRYQMAELSGFNEACIMETAPQRAVMNEEQQYLLAGSRPGKYLSPTRAARQADQSFWGIGISSLSVYSMLPLGHPHTHRSVGGSAGAWWWHSAHDTLDKADPEILADDTRLFWTILFRLSCNPALPHNFSLCAHDCENALREYAEAAAEHLDLAPLRQAAAALSAKAQQLRHVMDNLVPGPTLDNANELCLSLARILNPTLYTRISEVSITEQQPAIAGRFFPDLVGALALTNMEPLSLDYCMLLWSLQRKVTRINFSIVQATRILDAWLNSYNML